jgi:hypothetical protein
MGHPSKKSDEEGQTQTLGSRSPIPFTHLEEKQSKHDTKGSLQVVPVAVVEQRVSNLAQGALCLVLLSEPFLQVLHLIPRGVLAGLL